MTKPCERRVAVLWHLRWNDARLSCVIYRASSGLQLRIETPTGVILSEPFDMQPRAVAQTRALRESLKRRGWQDAL